jgi:hypothetical protein
LVAWIEDTRPQNARGYENPPMPSELELSYATALKQLPVIGKEILRRGCSESVVMGVVAATALAGGHRVLARAYLEFGRVDAAAYLNNLNGFTPSSADA